MIDLQKNKGLRIIWLIRPTKRSTFFIFLVITTWTFLVTSNLQFFQIGAFTRTKSQYDTFCHKSDRFYSLTHISRMDISDVTVQKDNSIFFHETSCNSKIKGKLVITSRQACAVESAAKMNPHLDVYLLYASPGNFYDSDTESDQFLKALMSYSNVKILHVNLERYMKGTPVESLWKSNVISESNFAISHLSDVLRYLTLWKYGGIYLDLDVIVMKSLKDLEPNFAGVESDDVIASSIMGFSSSGYGHQLASSCVYDLKVNFNGQVWGHNGPGTITRLAQRLCEDKKIKPYIGSTCKNLKIYSRSEFYGISYWTWKWLLDETCLSDVLSATKNSSVLHVWNKLSANSKIPLSSRKAPYLYLAKEFCPKVVRSCKEYF